MSVELRPYGVKCNIQCQYCYQNPMRDAGNVLNSYDMERMKAGVVKEGGPFTLFGGEPLMIPEKDLEELWRWGFEKYGSNNIQTNATLVNDEHVRMFKAYNVHVGVSVDGPDELNDVRWVRSLEKTRAATAATQAAIERLCDEKIAISLIVTLHRANATADKLPRMFDWLAHLESKGLQWARLHILEVEEPAIRAKYALTTEENLHAFRAFAAFERDRLTTLRFDVYREMEMALRGDDHQTSCIWNACDPYTTRAVRGVEGNGQTSNCGRTNKDGIDYTKADVEGFERYIALYQVPQEHGGCRDCRFFMMCKGQCPGTSLEGDWRNRTEHCGVWMALYSDIETRVVAAGGVPLSVDPRRKQLERYFIEGWMRGRNVYLHQALEYANQGIEPSAVNYGAGVNVSHGDSHGDHFDLARKGATA